jgi:hypothetical protein
MESKKKCGRCHELKLITQFGRTHGKLESRCKQCNNSVQKAYRENNPERSKETLHKSYMKHRKKRLEYGKMYRESEKKEKIGKSGQ